MYLLRIRVLDETQLLVICGPVHTFNLSLLVCDDPNDVIRHARLLQHNHKPARLDITGGFGVKTGHFRLDFSKKIHSHKERQELVLKKFPKIWDAISEKKESQRQARALRTTERTRLKLCCDFGEMSKQEYGTIVDYEQRGSRGQVHGKERVTKKNRQKIFAFGKSSTWS